MIELRIVGRRTAERRMVGRGMIERSMVGRRMIKLRMFGRRMICGRMVGRRQFCSRRAFYSIIAIPNVSNIRQRKVYIYSIYPPLICKSTNNKPMNRSMHMVKSN